MAGNGIVTIMLLMLLFLVVGNADHFTSLSFNYPPITTHQAPAASPNPTAPLPINTPTAFPSPSPIDTPIEFPSPSPIDTPISFPSRTPIDIPIIPHLPIPSIGVPKYRRCPSMCSRSCSLQRTNRFANMRCLGLCHLKCARGISDLISDCTNNCVDSKSRNFNPADVGDVVNHVSSCYADCMNYN